MSNITQRSSTETSIDVSDQCPVSLQLRALTACRFQSALLLVFPWSDRDEIDRGDRAIGRLKTAHGLHAIVHVRHART